MVISIKTIKKEDCKNYNHKRVGRQLATGNLICMDCKQEQIEKLFVNKQ